MMMHADIRTAMNHYGTALNADMRKASDAVGQVSAVSRQAKYFEFWGGRRESNPQRPEPQSGALPVELLPPCEAIITSGAVNGEL
jgi:hypothetical protein